MLARTPTFEDLQTAADLLVAHGRRADAVALVTVTLEALEDPRGALLLPRLLLETHRRSGAEDAIATL